MTKDTRQAARKLLETRSCVSDPTWYHVTTRERLPKVLRWGLKPRSLRGDRGNFKAWKRHGAGKLFVTQGLDNAREWAEILTAHGHDPVFLRVNTDLSDDVFLDYVGNHDVECSFWINFEIPPEDLDVIYANPSSRTDLSTKLKIPATRGTRMSIPARRSPSIKKLMETDFRYRDSYSGELHGEKGLTKAEAQLLKETFQNKSPRKALKIADEVIGGFGVESLYPDSPHIWYVNMGDPYRTTIIWNEDTDVIYIGNWGNYEENKS